MSDITFTQFFLYGIFPVILLVGMLMNLERYAEQYGFSGKKLKVMEAVFGLGGAFVVIVFWTQLAKQAQP